MTDDENVNEEINEEQEEEENTSEPTDEEDGGSEQSVYTELLSLAGESFDVQKPSETDNAFLLRLMEVAAEAPQSEFDAMSETAQAWVVDSMNAFNESAKAKLVLPSGFVSKHVTKTSAKTSDGTPKKRGRPAGKREDKPAKEPGKRGRKANTGTSVGHAIRTYFLKHTKATATQIQEHLVSVGFADAKATTISTYMTDTLATLKVMEELGLFSFPEV